VSKDEMSDNHAVQNFVDQIHVFAESLLKGGACPSCLAQALISEGFHLADQVGVLDLATETADRYANGDHGPVLSSH
jgi:hypothetical protein